MLANNLTAEDEDAVQNELRELQEQAIRDAQPEKEVSLPSAPTEEPVSAPMEEVGGKVFYARAGRTRAYVGITAAEEEPQQQRARVAVPG